MTDAELNPALPPAASLFPQRAYNHGAALCFVHVAKAAGTSVRLTIENAFPGDRTYPGASRLQVGAHTKVRQARDAGDDFLRFKALSAHAGAALGDMLAPDANLFTWLRDPTDRVISAFFYSVIQQRYRADATSTARVDAGERVETVFLDWLASPDADNSLIGQLVYGVPPNRAAWRQAHPGAGLLEAALEALRRCFFIGLMEDHDRSLDAFCALTSILPPKQSQKRNPGTSRPSRLDFTPDEQARFDAVLAPDRAFYALARQIYDLQMAELAERGRTDPALALLGDREGLRRHILQLAASQTPALATWRAWDPVLGENLDSREKLTSPEGETSRWRWTGNNPDTFLYFRLPRRTAFELRIHLAPATPPSHAEQTTLKLSGEPVPMALASAPEGRAELVATVPQSLASRLPELAELHLHTSRMLDESTLVPYAGTRNLGLAIEAISATPVSAQTLFWRRIGGPRVAGLTRRLLRRAFRS